MAKDKDYVIPEKKSIRIAREYGVTRGRVNQWAKAHDVQAVIIDGEFECYVFDEAAEKAFANRRKESPGRPAPERPPKVPGKPGRPCKKPVGKK